MTEAKQWIDELKRISDPNNAIIPLSLEQMKEDVLWYVIHYDYVSFAELQRRYGDQALGNRSIINRSDHNIILWPNLSDSLATAVLQLLEDKEIHLHPASLLTYLADGCVPQLPLAKRPLLGGIKRSTGFLCASEAVHFAVRRNALQGKEAGLFTSHK